MGISVKEYSNEYLFQKTIVGTKVNAYLCRQIENI